MEDINWELKNLDSLKEYIFDELIGEHKNTKDINEAINRYAERYHEMQIGVVVLSLSKEIECVCGWEGKIGNLYYREESNKYNIGAKLECPKCYTELVSEPN